jgi:glyoxylase-like metal-dependent hydrolase (beta-lactamase superfamily II)
MRPIDVRHLSRERVICCWQVGDVLIDPGPESAMGTLVEALHGEPPRALLLTHIHLDHAGATGALVRRWPGLEVYVHEVGAPHLVDPESLLASAGRLYGDQMQRMWGEVVPVPEGNITALRGGERLGGFRVAYTPGHASHHVSFLHSDSGRAFVGDVAGVRIPPTDFIRPPTPPPDIDVELWERSIELVGECEPARLALTHFAAVDEVQPHLERMKESLRAQAELVRRLLAERGDGDDARDEFVAEVTRRTRKACDDETLAVFEKGAPVEQLWYGLRRYWMKREQRS